MRFGREFFVRTIAYLSLFGALFVAALSGCSRPTIKADGSSTVLPISEAVAEEFRQEEPSIRVIVGRSGTGGGFKKFGNGEIDICDASRPITKGEQETCRANDIEYVELQIAFDGLSVCVNPANDWCDCLTVEQLKTIWQRGSVVSKWSDLNPAWPDEKIKLYGPGTDSGTFDYFTEAIVGEAGNSRSDYVQNEDDNTLVTGVAGDKFSLGYFGMAYYEENSDKLKVLGIDSGDGNCVKPTAATVRDNTYRPLSRPLFIYVRKSSLARPEVKSFVAFYLDRVGKVVPETGFVPVSDEVLEANRRVFEEALRSPRAAS
jgi:phosphate transport system substrate-binding protein